jgi:hypothetical protein
MSRSLRVLVAALLIALACNAIAHFAHQHEDAVALAVHAPSCGYCMGFDGFADAPRHTWAERSPAVEPRPLALASVAAPPAPRRAPANPRAPPLS